MADNYYYNYNNYNYNYYNDNYYYYNNYTYKNPKKPKLFRRQH